MSEELRINRWRGVRTDGDTEPHLIEKGERQSSSNLWARTGTLVRRPCAKSVRQFAESNCYVMPLALFSVDVETDDDVVENELTIGFISGLPATDRTRNTGVGVQLDDSGDGLPVQIEDP